MYPTKHRNKQKKVGEKRLFVLCEPCHVIEDINLLVIKRVWRAIKK
jgi:hypothetical protein